MRAGFASDAASLALIRASLIDPSARVRVLALRAGARRDSLSSPDWLRALGDADAEVRRDALVLLGERVAPDDVLVAVRDALGDPDPLVVDAAAFALGEHGDANSVDALCQAAAHEDARCREAAVAALGSIGDERALPTIIAALEDKAPVRRRAVVALANFEGDEVDRALARASEDRDWQVRAAVEQLTRD
ncbi:MAG TPA: HEAT repeat domain-containing protein [Acidimicrobiales bacterium]|nr:HEAT repeat domain-containing protein [Acidimicrobiales bacterium]